MEVPCAYSRAICLWIGRASGARDIRFPWALARAIPALTRSLIKALSNWANEAMTVKINSPCGVVVSMCS
jgi:hypothetical protein